MRTFITGSKGFVGQHLLDHLRKTEDSLDIREFNLQDGEDIRNYEQVRNALDAFRPNVIFHLAAQAAPAESFANPQRTMEVNLLGSLNVLEAVRQLGLKTTVQLTSTSEVYGPGENKEDSVFVPRSPYAVSKAAMDNLGKLYAEAYGTHVVVTRAFNHTGPGRGEMYAESAFAKQIAEIELGQRKTLFHGNLDSMRNYTDVRDIVRAYVLASKLPSGAYNICSPWNLQIAVVLEILTGLANVPIKTKFSRNLKRPADFDFQPPSCLEFQKRTDWEPEYTPTQTLEDLLNYWRERCVS